MDLFITVDVEVWPVHEGGWPVRPLSEQYRCERELSAYFVGETRTGIFGLPYQLGMLRRHGLSATYFVDPFFSFALGLDALGGVVRMIEGAGQRIALHVHPEWLTDPRCKGLPAFQGPHLSQYPVSDQRTIIRAGMDRLVEAGGQPIAAFRAGSWGADVETLEALRLEGIACDSSLNAIYPYSMPSLPGRMLVQEPVQHDGVLEYPISRFVDRASRAGRPLSVIGTSWSELRFVLENCAVNGRNSVVLVMHGNEFVRTEQLWKQRALTPRRIVIWRFEQFCAYLERNRGRFCTRFIGDHGTLRATATSTDTIPESAFGRTLARFASQAASRWL